MEPFDHLPGRRRPGWFKAKPGTTLDLQIRSQAFDAESWREFRECTRPVEELRPFIIDWLAFSADYDAVLRSEMEIGTELTQALALGMISVPLGVEANARAQRSISNFLGAASAFRDRSENRLRRAFDKDSGQLVAWKKEVSRAFDASFAYRCLYQLRNYAQHHELPISFVPISASRSEESVMEARVAMHLYPGFLASSGDINAKVRTELRSLPEDALDLSLLAREYMSCHRRFMALILNFYRPRLEEMAHYAVAFYRTFEIPEDATPVVWEGDDPSNGPAGQNRAIMTGFDEMLRAFALMEHLAAEI